MESSRNQPSEDSEPGEPDKCVSVNVPQSGPMWQDVPAGKDTSYVTIVLY